MCTQGPPEKREPRDRKSTRLNSSHITRTRMPSSAWKKKKNKNWKLMIGISQTSIFHLFVNMFEIYPISHPMSNCNFDIIHHFSNFSCVFNCFVRVLLCIICGNAPSVFLYYPQVVYKHVDNALPTGFQLWTHVCVYWRYFHIFITTLVCFCG